MTLHLKKGRFVKLEVYTSKRIGISRDEVWTEKGTENCNLGFYSFTLSYPDFVQSSIKFSSQTVATPARRVAVKTELSCRNDTRIVFFFAANKNKGNAKVALASPNT